MIEFSQETLSLNGLEMESSILSAMIKLCSLGYVWNEGSEEGNVTIISLVHFCQITTFLLSNSLHPKHTIINLPSTQPYLSLSLPVLSTSTHPQTLHLLCNTPQHKFSPVNHTTNTPQHKNLLSATCNCSPTN